MKIRPAVDRMRFRTMTTAELRESFLISGLFRAGELYLEYCETERAVVGGAVPTSNPLELAVGKELAAEYFCERREVGVLNIGGNGRVVVDGESHALGRLDCLYVGRGSRRVIFLSEESDVPAKFYLLSYPAHAVYPTHRAGLSEISPLRLGSEGEANRRTIFKLIHAGGVRSCQLVMGYTALEEGHVWNTMPAHTHGRRSEIYLYFNMGPGDRVFHFLGPAEETRHVVVSNEEAVISPSWSIHSGVGTRSYMFCWGMGGENQEFGDVDPVGMESLK